MSNNMSSWWESNNDLTDSQVDNSAQISIIKGNTKDIDAPFNFVKHPLGYIDHSLVGGRGVFASQDIATGELIERCPLVPLELRSKEQKDKAVWTYCYTKPLCNCEECKAHGFLFYMVLGLGMIYNHQDNNNAEMLFDHKQYYVDIKAIKDIKKDDEIFVSYGRSYFNHRPKIVVDND